MELNDEHEGCKKASLFQQPRGDTIMVLVKAAPISILLRLAIGGAEIHRAAYWTVDDSLHQPGNSSRDFAGRSNDRSRAKLVGDLSKLKFFYYTRMNPKH